MTETYISLETLWFCTIINTKQLEEVLREETKRLARSALREMSKIIMKLLNLNARARFEYQPSIEGYLAANSRILREMGFADDETAQKPDYQGLKLSTS
jgi:hypothetical protein